MRRKSLRTNFLKRTTTAKDEPTYLVVWHSGSALVSIKEVNLRRARLVLGWVIVSGFSSRCGTFISVCNQPPGQLSLVISSWVTTISTSQRTVTPRCWGVSLCVWMAYLPRYVCGWQVDIKLCDTLVIHWPYLSALAITVIKRYTN